MKSEEFDNSLVKEASGMFFHDDSDIQREKTDSSNNYSAMAVQHTKFSAQSNENNCNFSISVKKHDHHSSIPDISMIQCSAMCDQEILPSNCDTFMDSSVSFPYGLDNLLFPLRVDQSTLDVYSAYLQSGIPKEYYANAVKHLKQALHSNPPVWAALLPFIQLMLLGDQVDEALGELDYLCQCSDSVHPFRFRAHLLECFSQRKPNSLSASYEDILGIDPTCTNSIDGLIRMYRNGDYNVESLIEMLALHLDATYALCRIWGELASCFLELLQSCFAEDCMSEAEYKNGNRRGPVCWSLLDPIHPMFMKSEARKSWRMRCRWWSSRHFSEDKYLSDLQSGDKELLAFKAACASHIYEPKFRYADRVRSFLEEQNDAERLLYLQKHFQNSMKLQGKLIGAG